MKACEHDKKYWLHGSRRCALCAIHEAFDEFTKKMVAAFDQVLAEEPGELDELDPSCN